MISSENSIVTFLDILGYAQWVQDTKPEQAIKALEKHFLAFDEIKKHPSHIYKTLFDNISIHSLSDSLVIVLPDIDKLPSAFPEFPEKTDSDWFSIQTYLGIVSWIAFHLIVDTKSLVRGAITKGQYFQKEISSSNNQFVFSKALYKAHRLEQKAGTPRIIIEDSIQQDILSKEKSLSSLAFRDDDEVLFRYLYNFYSSSRTGKAS